MRRRVQNPAVDRATVGSEEEHPIRIAVDQVGHDLEALFAQGVLALSDLQGGLFGKRDHLAPHRAWALSLGEEGVVRSDAKAKQALGSGETLPLLATEREETVQALDVLDTVALLPTPVRKLLRVHAGPRRALDHGVGMEASHLGAPSLGSSDCPVEVRVLCPPRTPDSARSRPLGPRTAWQRGRGSCSRIAARTAPGATRV